MVDCIDPWLIKWTSFIDPKANANVPSILFKNCKLLV